MTETKGARHTPGPWDCWDMDEFGWHVFADAFGGPHKGQDCRLSIAAVRPGRSHIEARDNYYEQVANARLISAAPDLLTIAQRWAALDAGAWNAERHSREKDELLADTRAAIARATGERP